MKRAVARLVWDKVLVICDVIAVEVGCGGGWLMREGGKTVEGSSPLHFIELPRQEINRNV